MTHCIFCKIVSGQLPSIKIHEDDKVMAFMDIYPLRRGHVLVIPKIHQPQLHDLPEDSRTHLINTASRVAQALYASPLKPAAVHYVVNDGPAAQQTVPHVHMHVLPRYKGDSLGFVARLLRKPFDLALGPEKPADLEALAADLRHRLAKV
ncbi:MAG: HIT family protein [Moraxellaceae bacterium]